MPDERALLCQAAGVAASSRSRAAGRPLPPWASRRPTRGQRGARGREAEVQLAAAGESADLTTRMAGRAEEQRLRLAALLEEIATIAQLAERNGHGATGVATAAREQAETLAEVERAVAALGQVSVRLNTYIARFNEMGA